jgi:pyruvate dehydrogenase E2 component (dihydrolipoamide acetyltransferase)
MPYDVKLPDIGEGIAEGEIVRWFVKAGEAVKEDQPLVEVMTDKASVEIPSPRTGVIAALMAEAGEMVPVGQVIVSIALPGDGSADAQATAPAAKSSKTTEPPEAKTAAPAAATRGTSTRAQALPAVRQLAKKLGVDIEHVAGTGADGRVTAEDVERAAAAGARPASSPAAAPSADEERIPVRGLRRLIAEHMRRSIDTAAHFTFVAECDWTDLAAHRAALKPRAEAAGVKLTYLAYVAKALVQPLRDFPILNASLDDARAEVVIRRRLHLGIATHTPEGLTVPVIHDSDRLSLFALAGTIQKLAEGARAGTLKLPELQGGTFTVTSTGAHGGVLATPILHHPQVAILGVHEVRKRPAVVDDRIVIRELGNLSLSLDHRVVDGAVGADFLYALIARLEHPEHWLGQGDIE